MQVLTASNGAEAVEVFRQQRPQLVLMDAMMPVMDGFEAARQIKQLAGETLVPIIFLTSLTRKRSPGPLPGGGRRRFSGKAL